MRLSHVIAAVCLSITTCLYAATLPDLCSSTIPTKEKPAVSPQEKLAYVALQTVIADSLSNPCTDPTKSATGCKQTADDLTKLVAAAAKASLLLNYCATFGVTDEDKALSDSVKEWDVARAALWDNLDSEQKANNTKFKDGTYVLPSRLKDALSLTFNVALAPLPSPPPTFYALTPVRLMGGIDVSAAASTDPAAKFLLEAALEMPIVHGSEPIKSDHTQATRTNLLGSKLWTSGYIRLASIAQPGAISGTSDAATYIQPLLSSTPNQLVQSAEAEMSIEYSLFSSRSNTDTITVGPENTPDTTVHFIAESGLITPVSPTQANPTIYQVTQSLYNFYTPANPSSALAAAAKAQIISACGSTFTTTPTATTCYVAYIPQDRTHFYRNYSAGFRIRTFYHSADPDKHYLYPNILSATFGQNEYVTGGMMRHYVLHLSGTASLPPSIGGNLAGLLYAYGAVDMGFGTPNQSSQQFLLATAPSSAAVTTSSSDVAAIAVATPNRDRYRFGLALDLAKLITLMKPKT